MPRWSKERRAKHSAFMQAWWRKPANKKKQSALISAALLAPEVRARTADTQRELWATPEYREKMLTALADPAVRARMSAKQKARCAKAEEQKRRVEQGRALWREPEFRRRMEALFLDPENRRRRSERTKAQWRDPVYRASRSAEFKARWDDPEYRARGVAILRELGAEPRQRAIKSARLKAQWCDVDYRRSAEARLKVIRDGRRHQLSAESKARWSLVEYRQYMTAVCSARMEAFWREPKLRAVMLANLRSARGRAASLAYVGKQLVEMLGLREFIPSSVEGGAKTAWYVEVAKQLLDQTGVNYD